MLWSEQCRKLGEEHRCYGQSTTPSAGSWGRSIDVMVRALHPVQEVGGGA